MKSAGLLIAALLIAAPVSAHVTLQVREAKIGSHYRATFVVPHGCAGSPTVKLRVQIPPGVIAIAATPTQGWQVNTVTGKYPETYEMDGKKVGDGITEVDWSGGKLPDKTRETFAIDTFLSSGLKPNTKLSFPTIQECEQGISRWIEIPADDAHSGEDKRPAPAVKLLPAP
jgi:uncharacterized protein YcnI